MGKWISPDGHMTATLARFCSPAMVDDHIEVTPGLKLSLPVADGGEGNDHQERASDPSILEW